VFKVKSSFKFNWS